MKKIVKSAFRFIAALWYYFWAHILIALHYDKKYITGRFFTSPHHNVYAIGWRWVVSDYYQSRKNCLNIGCRFPVSGLNWVNHPENIEFCPDDLNIFHSYGKYFQANGKITIGRGTYIAPNVGLITANHTIGDLAHHDEPKEIVLGEKCWIGMNAMVLPGVHLGDQTIVGAGSVVTKSFPDGYCVIAGNPAKVIREIPRTPEKE